MSVLIGPIGETAVIVMSVVIEMTAAGIAGEIATNSVPATRCARLVAVIPMAAGIATDRTADAMAGTGVMVAMVAMVAMAGVIAVTAAIA